MMKRALCINVSCVGANRGDGFILYRHSPPNIFYIFFKLYQYYYSLRCKTSYLDTFYINFFNLKCEINVVKNMMKEVDFENIKN